MGISFFGEELSRPSFTDFTTASAVSVISWGVIILGLQLLPMPLDMGSAIYFLMGMLWGSLCAVIVRRRTWQRFLLICCGIGAIMGVKALIG